MSSCAQWKSKSCAEILRGPFPPNLADLVFEALFVMVGRLPLAFLSLRPRRFAL